MPTKIDVIGGDKISVVPRVFKIVGTVSTGKESLVVVKYVVFKTRSTIVKYAKNIRCCQVAEIPICLINFRSDYLTSRL